MSELKINPNRRFLRPEKLPHFFCSGCGCGQVLNYFCQALDALDMKPEEMLTIGGVGCTARIPVYLKSDTFHGVHGRTLAWATGVKMHKPELPVVIFAGDGDLTSIGGNHFIHAARRNLDVTVRFDVCELAKAAGATHVERWTTSRPNQCVAAIKRALQHKGFSLIEIVSQCPTHFGRYALKTGDPQTVLEWIHKYTYTDADAKKLAPEELEGKLRCGEFVRIDKPIYNGSNEQQ